MLEKVGFEYNGKKFHLETHRCNWFERFSGLMFKGRDYGALLFDFKKPVKLMFHSLFVFFPFVAVWIDEDGKVIEVKRIKPFTFSIRSKKSFVKVIEIPINKMYWELTRSLVDDTKSL